MCQCGDNVKVSLLVWCTWYTDTFCNAVDYRFKLALEVQRWTTARSECLPGAGKNYSTSRTSLLQGHLTVLKLTVTVCHTAEHYGEEYDD